MEPLSLLLVEDDAANLELMGEVFSSLSARVRPISDSRTADTLIRREKFDGIFLDLKMPTIDGLQLAARVRESTWNKLTPIVIVTGCDAPNVMQEAFAKGANFFIQKPVDREKLKRLFRTVKGSFTERRRHSFRIPMHTEVDCRIGARHVRGRIWNISLGGMQVEVLDLQPGTTLALCFCLPMSSKPLEVTGNVIWSKEDRQGIRFVDLSQQNGTDIRDFVNREFESAERQ